MQSDTTFTSTQLINQINNWALEPLTEQEKQYLLSFAQSQDTFEYGEDDIESLLLEALSDMEDSIDSDLSMGIHK